MGLGFADPPDQTWYRQIVVLGEGGSSSRSVELHMHIPDEHKNHATNPPDNLQQLHIDLDLNPIIF